MKTKTGLILFIAIAGITLLVSAYADIAFSNLFFTSKGFLKDNPILQAIYKYALIPAWLVVLAALLLTALSYKNKTLAYYRPGLQTLLLTLLIGSGIICNAALKDHWGRPRPIQTKEFGGEYPFRTVYQPKWSWVKSDTRSFPSGHSTMGFYFFALYIFARRYKFNRLKILSIILLIALGGLLSFARLAQGGHYLSDILASAIIMTYTANIIDKILNRGFKNERLDSTTT